MCTVTYLPLSPQGDFVLTSNRDETPQRGAIQLVNSDDGKMVFPREPKAGGTWICTHQEERLVCLLNGAFEKHHHHPPYKRSRGLVVLDFFTYTDAATFVQQYDFEGIEPFTMVIVEQGKLYELRWDEQQAHFQQLNAQQPYIWSSSPLYNREIRAMRQSWFDNWLIANPIPSSESILQFHQTAGTGDPTNDVMMYRHDGAIRTISITQIVHSQHQHHYSISYRDLIHEQFYHTELGYHTQPI